MSADYTNGWLAGKTTGPGLRMMGLLFCIKAIVTGVGYSLSPMITQFWTTALYQTVQENLPVCFPQEGPRERRFGVLCSLDAVLWG